jgi:two-component system, sensor histidine kinase and response regulator
MDNIRMVPLPLILVVDDEESMRDSCAQIIAKLGCRVETAEDGATGLEKVRILKPDAVIVDLKMPGMGGLDVLNEVQLIDSQIVAIVITGYATVDAAVEAMKRGAYDFLPKPFTPDELRLILARALERRHLSLEAETLRREKKLLQDNIITMVSHQLRSPLVAIQQYFEVLLSGIAGGLEDKSREMIRRASERLTGLLELVNDWLQLARFDAGGLVAKLQPVDLRVVLDRLIDFLAPLAREYDVTLEWGDPPRTGIAALGDEASLEQVFTNLLHNGIIYNKRSGRVQVRLGEDGDDVTVEIRDTGIGIAAEHLPLIFDQFYRIHRSEETKAKGSGLGLAIVKQIVDAHRGRVEVSSEPGSGTAFTVRLPKAPQEGASG